MVANQQGVGEVLRPGSRRRGGRALTAPEGRVVCEAYGIPLPREGLATSAGEAATVAGAIGFPVVLKIVSPDILHKTDAGGVVVGVQSAEAASQAYEQIVDSAKRYNPSAQIVGVQIQELAPKGIEVIVGAVTDPSFGKLVAFGLGGILVEVLKDITFRLAPTSQADALDMLDSIKAAEVLQRRPRQRAGRPRSARRASSSRSRSWSTDYPEIVELDLNPVFALPHGASAVDVRIVVRLRAGQPRATAPRRKRS